MTHPTTGDRLRRITGTLFLVPRWLGVTGLVVSALYLSNQGDILATALPGFPVWDLGGLIGSTTWGLWIAALGVTLLARPFRTPRSATGAEGTIPAATRTPLATTGHGS